MKALRKHYVPTHQNWLVRVVIRLRAVRLQTSSRYGGGSRYGSESGGGVGSSSSSSLYDSSTPSRYSSSLARDRPSSYTAAAASSYSRSYAPSYSTDDKVDYKRVSDGRQQQLADFSLLIKWSYFKDRGFFSDIVSQVLGN